MAYFSKKSNAFTTTNTLLYFKVYADASGADEANNLTRVRVRVNAYKSKSSTESTYGHGTIYVKIDGVQYSESITTDHVIFHDGVFLFDKTVDIKHDADGRKELKVSVRISHSRFTASEQEWSVRLPDIARATKPTISPKSCNIGSGITISLPRASTAFSHNLKYSFGSLTNQTDGLSKASGVAESAVLTVPMDLRNEFGANELTKTLTLTCDTYSGSTRIGSATVTASVSLPNTAEFSPEILSVETYPVPAGSTVIPEQFDGLYIQGRTNLRLLVSAQGKERANIVGYTAVIEGKQLSNTTGDFTTDKPLSVFGDQTITVTVTDSRGRFAQAAVQIYVHQYSAPAVLPFYGDSAPRAERCYETGEANTNGTYAKVRAGNRISAINGLNTGTLEYRYGTTDLWSGWMTLADGNSDGVAVFGGGHLDPSVSYIVQLRAIDLLAESPVVNVIVPIAMTPLHLGNGGLNAALGQYCSYRKPYLIELGWEADMNGQSNFNADAVFNAGVLVGAKTLKEYIQENQKPTDDTGWIDLGLSSSVREADTPQYGRYNGCAYRVINGNHVYITLCCGMTFSGPQIIVNEKMLPVNYRPPTYAYDFFVLNGRHIGRAFARASDGAVVVEWIQQITSASSTPSATVSWCALNFDYFI